jgi:hypothetical protein
MDQPNLGQGLLPTHEDQKSWNLYLRLPEMTGDTVHLVINV